VQAPAVRADGMALVALVHRSGVIAPWLYLPPVVALATDTGAAASERALRVLKYCAARAVCLLSPCS
jgi:hypothetical protein